MPYTKTSILSLALIELGKGLVTSLDGGDDIVTSASLIYDTALPAALAANTWRFATQISQLSLSADVPVTYWTKSYILPAGYLKTVRIHPNTYDYEIYQSKRLYTHTETEWYMEYVFQPDESLFPAHFVQYFKYEISTALALTNAEQTGYQTVLEKKRISSLALAVSIDAQNRPNASQMNFPVLDARNIGGFIRDFN